MYYIHIIWILSICFSDNVLLLYVYLVSCVDLYLMYLYVADKAFFILKIFGGLSRGSPGVLSHPHPLQRSFLALILSKCQYCFNCSHNLLLCRLCLCIYSQNPRFTHSYVFIPYCRHPKVAYFLRFQPVLNCLNCSHNLTRYNQFL